MALLLDEETKELKLQNAREAVVRNDLSKWVSDQLRDIEAVMMERQELKTVKPEEVRFKIN